MWGDESEAVAPIIWLYQPVDAQKEEVFFPDLLITLRSYGLPLYGYLYICEIYVNLIGHFYLFMLNTICLSVSLSIIIISFILECINV